MGSVSAALKGENVDPANRGDVHEAWDMGDDSQMMREGKPNGNQWPSKGDLPEFQPKLQRAWCVLASRTAPHARRGC